MIEPMKQMLLLAVSLLLLGSCQGGAGVAVPYRSITPEEAYALMQKEPGCVILDVRTPEEYASGHVPGAVLLPYDEVTAESAAALLAHKSQTVLVYCRSGRRSKLGAETLSRLGYTRVLEFGGILDWPYGIEK